MGKPNPGPPPREHLVQRRGFACVPTAMGFSCCNPKQLKLRFLYIGATRNLSFRKAAYSGACAHPFRQHPPTYSGVFAHP